MPRVYQGSGGRPSVTSSISRATRESFETATRKALNQRDIVNTIVDQLTFDPSPDVRNSALFTASLISRLWNAPATKALYQHLEPTTPFGANALLATLRKRPDLAREARSFVLPTFPNLHFPGTNAQRTPKFKNPLARIISNSKSSNSSSSNASEDWGSFSSDDYYGLLQTFNLIGNLLVPPKPDPDDPSQLQHLSLPCIINGEPRISGTQFFFAGRRLNTLVSLTCHSALLAKGKASALGLFLPLLTNLTLVGQCHHEIDVRARGWLDLPSLESLSLAHNTFSVEFLAAVLANFQVMFVSSLTIRNVSFKSDPRPKDTIPATKAFRSFASAPLLTSLSLDLQTYADPFDKRTDLECLESLTLRGHRWKTVRSVMKDLPITAKLVHLHVTLTNPSSQETFNVVKMEMKTLLEGQTVKFPKLERFNLVAGSGRGVIALSLTKKRSR